jgi:hypothetical protein
MQMDGSIYTAGNVEHVAVPGIGAATHHGHGPAGHVEIVIVANEYGTKGVANAALLHSHRRRAR